MAGPDGLSGPSGDHAIVGDDHEDGGDLEATELGGLVGDPGEPLVLVALELHLDDEGQERLGGAGFVELDAEVAGERRDLADGGIAAVEANVHGCMLEPILEARTEQLSQEPRSLPEQLDHEFVADRRRHRGPRSRVAGATERKGPPGQPIGHSCGSSGGMVFAGDWEGGSKGTRWNATTKGCALGDPRGCLRSARGSRAGRRRSASRTT